MTRMIKRATHWLAVVLLAGSPTWPIHAKTSGSDRPPLSIRRVQQDPIGSESTAQALPNVGDILNNAGASHFDSQAGAGAGAGVSETPEGLPSIPIPGSEGTATMETSETAEWTPSMPAMPASPASSPAASPVATMAPVVIGGGVVEYTSTPVVEPVIPEATAAPVMASTDTSTEGTKQNASSPLPPSPGHPRCDVCGPGKEVSNPEVVLTIPLSEPKTCKALQTAGQNGFIEEQYCGLMGGLVAPCECADVGTLGGEDTVEAFDTLAPVAATPETWSPIASAPVSAAPVTMEPMSLDTFEPTVAPVDAATQEPSVGSVVATPEPSDSPSEVPMNEIVTTSVPSSVPSVVPTQTSSIGVPGAVPVNTIETAAPVIEDNSDGTVPTAASPVSEENNNAHQEENNEETEQEEQQEFDSNPGKEASRERTTDEEELEKEVEDEEEEIREVENEAKTAGGFGIALAFLGMIFTAHQMSENPDGIYASICRLCITMMGCILKVLLMPCRQLFGARYPAGHMPVSTLEYREPYRGDNNMMEMT